MRRVTWHGLWLILHASSSLLRTNDGCRWSGILKTITLRELSIRLRTSVATELMKLVAEFNTLGLVLRVGSSIYARGLSLDNMESKSSSLSKSDRISLSILVNRPRASPKRSVMLTEQSVLSDLRLAFALGRLAAELGIFNVVRTEVLSSSRSDNRD